MAQPELKVIRDLVHARHGLLTLRGKAEYDVIRNIFNFVKLSKNQTHQMEEKLKEMHLRVAHYDDGAGAVRAGFPPNEDMVSLIYDVSHEFGKIINNVNK